MKTLEHHYVPRSFFHNFHERMQRWAAVVAHRRCGKTVAAINDKIAKAAYSEKPQPRYAYIAPFYSQAKAIAWDMLKHYTRGLSPKISEASLSVEFPHNHARITLYGADNPDALRGIYLDGATLDEYGLMKPQIFTEVIRPTLADRHGWATFIGTPNGPNHFHDVWEAALADSAGWYTLSLPYQVTNILSPEEIEDLRKIMTDDEFAQEMECNFYAAMRGSYYGKELEQAELANPPRIGLYPHDRTALRHYVFDLGYTDSTAILGWQEHPQQININYAYSADSKPIGHYIDLLHSMPKPVGNVWLPHDAKAKSLQTGRTIIEQFLSAGIRPRLVPNVDINDGIAAARLLFPNLRFDLAKTAQFLKALRVYHREWSAERKTYLDRPTHDWSSHFADTFRYLCLVAQLKVIHKKNLININPSFAPTVQAMGQFSLNQLFEENTRGRIRDYY